MNRKRIFDYIKNPQKIFLAILSQRYCPFINDEQYIKWMYKDICNKNLNLKNPITFCEKLQWLKLNDRNNEYIKMVDKIKSKEYVGNLIGKEHIIRNLGIYETFNEIDFDELPNKFVIKTSHDSGSVEIIKDKYNIDLEKLKKKFNKALKKNYFYYGREWPYKKVKPKILIEVYMNDEENELKDYKFFCFNGEPLYCQVIDGRCSLKTIDFYNMEWEHLDFTGLGYPYKPHSVKEIKKPNQLNEMIDYCRLLSKNISFVRIDFYESDNIVYFGEITFYPASGFGAFYPDKWNKILGDKINLEGINNKK